jgi:hypothetical protein
MHLHTTAAAATPRLVIEPTAIEPEATAIPARATIHASTTAATTIPPAASAPTAVSTSTATPAVEAPCATKRAGQLVRDGA